MGKVWWSLVGTTEQDEHKLREGFCFFTMEARAGVTLAYIGLLAPEWMQRWQRKLLRALAAEVGPLAILQVLLNSVCALAQ